MVIKDDFSKNITDEPDMQDIVFHCVSRFDVGDNGLAAVFGMRKASDINTGAIFMSAVALTDPKNFKNASPELRGEITKALEALQQAAAGKVAVIDHNTANAGAGAAYEQRVLQREQDRERERQDEMRRFITSCTVLSAPMKARRPFQLKA